MTTPEERYRALHETIKFLKELTADPEATKNIKNAAIWLLRHYPSKSELDALALACPRLLSTGDMDQLYKMILEKDIKNE